LTELTVTELNRTRDKRTMKLLNIRKSIVQQCAVCNKMEKAFIINGEQELISDVCKVYLNPERQWRVGECPTSSIDHKKVVKECEDCGNIKRIIEDKIDICELFTHPDQKWLTGLCPKALFTKNRYGKVNPQKASRRKMENK